MLETIGDFYVPDQDEDFGTKVDSTIRGIAKTNRGKETPNGLQVIGDYRTVTDGDMTIGKYGHEVVFENTPHLFSGYNTTPKNTQLNRPEYVVAELGIDNFGTVGNYNWDLIKVPVFPGREYTFVHSSGLYAPVSVGVLGFYDSSGVQLSFLDMSTLPDDLTGTGKVVTTPAGCTQIWKNNKPLTSDFSDDIITQGNSAIIESTKAEKAYIDKNVVFFGDSITADPDWWVKYMLERIQFKNYVNLANSGATWSHTASTVYNTGPWGGSISDNNVIWNQINAHIAGAYPTPDVAVILAGTNDIARTLGTPSTVFNGSTQNVDPATHTDIASAFRFCIDLLYATYPTIKIIVATPIPRASLKDTATPQRAEIIRECASYCGCEVLDQYNEAGFYDYHEWNTHTKISADNIHPTDLGNQILGEFNANRLIASIGGN